MMHNARYDAIHGKERKILTLEEVLQRLPIAFAYKKAGNVSENLLN